MVLIIQGCVTELLASRIKHAVPIIPLRESAAFWEYGHLNVPCKKLLDGTLSLRNYNSVSHDKTLNKITLLGMPEAIVIV